MIYMSYVFKYCFFFSFAKLLSCCECHFCRTSKNMLNFEDSKQMSNFEHSKQKKIPICFKVWYLQHIQRRNALRNGRENPWGLAEPHLDDSVERSVEVAESARKSWGRDGLGLEGLEERLKLVKRMARLMTFTDSGIFMKSWGIVHVNVNSFFWVCPWDHCFHRIVDACCNLHAISHAWMCLKILKPQPARTDESPHHTSPQHLLHICSGFSALDPVQHSETWWRS